MSRCLISQSPRSSSSQNEKKRNSKGTIKCKGFGTDEPDRKEQIKKEEEKERLQKEKEEKEKKEAEEAAANETIPEKKDEFTEEPMKSTTDDEAIGLSEDIPSYQADDATADTGSLSREELGTLLIVLSEDITSTSSPAWLQKIQHTVRNILQAVNRFQTPVDKSEAAHVHKEYDESSPKLCKMQSRISSLSRKLKQEFGPEKEFYSFYGQCFETKYVYKVCPFKQATQVEGHSTTRLGNWENFEESCRVMHFSNGANAGMDPIEV